MEELEYQNFCTFLGSDANKRVWPENVKVTEKRNFRRKCSKYVLVNGTLHYMHGKHGQLRVIKETEKDTILNACHKAKSAGHLGVNKTTKKIAERYYWPKMNADIQDYIGKNITHLH